MIRPRVRQTLGTGSPRSYAAVMAGLWIDLELTLARLDVLAADAERLLEDRETLPAAALLPAIRAGSIDPAAALRGD